MEITSKKNKKYYKKILKRIFKSIENNSPKNKIFFFLIKMIELTNIIIVIDIIFKYKNNKINSDFFIYFINPIFYTEILLNKFSNNSEIYDNNCFLTEDKYNNQQISLISKKYFNINIYKESCYLLNKLYLFIIILFINLLFFILSLKIKYYKFVSYIKKLCSIILYILFKILAIPLLYIFNKKFFLQFSNDYIDIKYNFCLDFFLLVYFNYIFYLFYFYFIYSYNKTFSIVLVNNNLHSFYFIVNELSCIIIVLRFNTYSIIIELFWTLMFFLLFKLETKHYLLRMRKKNYEEINYAFLLLILCYFLIKGINLICHIKKSKIEKYLNIAILLFLFIFFYYLIINLKRITQLSDLIKYYNKKDDFILYVCYQIFEPLLSFFYHLLYDGKNLFKDGLLKEHYRENFKLFCKNNEDLNYLEDYKDKFIFNFEHSNSLKEEQKVLTIRNNMNNDKDYIDILLFIIKKNEKKIKLENSFVKNKYYNFFKKLEKVLIFYKILIYFILDNDTFRAQYFLKKFLYKKKSVLSFLSLSIFSIINKMLKIFEEKNKDEINPTSFLIIFQTLNDEYLKLLKHFEDILSNFKSSKIEIYKTIDLNVYKIKRSLKRIYKICSGKFKDNLMKQTENEKFMLIENILFSYKFEHNLNFFDISNLDQFVEKNNSFLIMIENDEFIIKKVPLFYSELTDIDIILINNKNFYLIFPPCIAISLIKKIKKMLFKFKNYNLETVVLDSNNFLLGVNLYFKILPTLKGNNYIICKIENANQLISNSYAIVNQNNVFKYISQFYYNFFGIKDISNLNLNLFKLFGIHDIDLKYDINLNNIDNNKDEIIYIKKYNFTYRELYKNAMKFIKKEKFVIQNDFEEKIKKLFSKSKQNNTLTIDVINKEKFINFETNEDIYLFKLNFKGLPIYENEIGNNTILEETFILNAKVLEQNNNFNVSMISKSIASSKIQNSAIGDIDADKKIFWRIINYKDSKGFFKEKNIYSKISLLYNFILIIMAILLLIYINKETNYYFQINYCLVDLRMIKINFLYGIFFMLHIIKIQDYEKYNISYINDEYTKNIKDYDFNINNFINNLYKNFVDNLFDLFEDYKLNFYTLNSNNKFQKIIYDEYEILFIDGYKKYNFINLFEIYIDFFYIYNENYKIGFNYTIVNYNKIPEYINKNLSSNYNQMYYLIIYNFNTILNYLNDVIEQAVKIYNDIYKSYTIKVYIIIIIFFFLNFISIVIIILSMKIEKKKIVKIIESMVKIENYEKENLFIKIFFCRKIILNEIKPSLAINELHKSLTIQKKHIKKIRKTLINYKSLNPNLNNNNNQPIKRQKTVYFKENTSTFENNYNEYHNNNSTKKDLMVKFNSSIELNNKLKNKFPIYYSNFNHTQPLYNFYFKIWIIIIKNILLLCSIYIIFIVIVFPILYNKFQSISFQKDVIYHTKNLNEYSLEYYLVLKLSILLIDKSYGNNIYKNGKDIFYEKYHLMRKYFRKSKYNNYFDEIFSNAGEYIINNFISYENKSKLIDILKYEKFSIQKIETIFTSYIAGIEIVYYNYIMNNITEENIINYYYSKNFQFSNIIQIIYFKSLIENFIYSLLSSDFDKLVKNLEIFLIVIFIFIVLIEILNYILSVYKIDKKLKNIIDIYNVIKKFFISNEEENKN